MQKITPAKINEEAYQKSVELLRKCATKHGFVAAKTQNDNYHRIWSRDGMINGLAALATGEQDLIDTFRENIYTLTRYQGPHGEIPSNVDPKTKHVSYGGTTGRVDATIWFVIGAAQYYKHTHDSAFLENIFTSLEKCMWLLGAWEFNQKGFVYVPPTGDWADEYIQQGYVLYDQLLYWRAMKEFAFLMKKAGHKNNEWVRKAERLQKMIRANFWICDIKDDDPNLYHKVLFEKGREFCSVQKHFWMPFFSPFGYGFRFDSFANTLASLFDLATSSQRRQVDSYISERFGKNSNYMLPAFHPVIEPIDEEWDDLQISFSYTFKNNPYEFHNGGLWSMVTGFYVVDLARRGRTALAKKYLAGIAESNRKNQDKSDDWGFYEFIHGRDGTPKGQRHQAWSASGYILGYKAIENPKKVFI